MVNLVVNEFDLWSLHGGGMMRFLKPPKSKNFEILNLPQPEDLIRFLEAEDEMKGLLRRETFSRIQQLTRYCTRRKE